jgi:hypothetical protein
MDQAWMDAIVRPPNAEPSTAMPSYLPGALVGGGVPVEGQFPPNLPPTISGDQWLQAAARQKNSVQPPGGRQEGGATRFLETFVPNALEGWWDLITLPARERVPMPKGLYQTDSGEWWVGERRAHETPEGRAWLEDQQKRRDWGPAMALAMLGIGRLPGAAPPNAIGTFVGQKGAPKLNQGGLHPAIDPAKAISDVEAHSILQARKQAGDLRDADIWDRSTWSWGAEGKLKKEILDTGSRLEATGKRQPLGEEYVLRHPAGDIHGVYDIKPMVISPRIGAQYGRGTAFFDEATGRIYIDGDMSTPAGAARAHKKALEEFQHAVQAKEGFARGTDPKNEVYFPEYWQALGQRMPSVRDTPGIFRRHQEIIERGVNNHNERGTPEFKAAIETYKRVAGEAETDNVLRRFEEPDLYRQHPSETTKVPPHRQIVRDPNFQSETINNAYRWGAFKSPYD